MATIDVILSALASPDLGWDGWDGPGEVADCLKAIRQTDPAGQHVHGLALAEDIQGEQPGLVHEVDGEQLKRPRVHGPGKQVAQLRGSPY